jgi:hypothetical protein
LMSAPVSRSVANRVSQVSQPATTLRQCDSCPYPFRDRAPTVALSLSEYWRGKLSVAKERFAASPIASTGWGYKTFKAFGARNRMGRHSENFFPGEFERKSNIHGKTQQTKAFRNSGLKRKNQT